MKTLDDVIQEMVGLFEREGLSYAIMGGVAVRVHALPRPTFEVDFMLLLLKRRQKQPLDGRDTWFISAEDLILLKLLAHRPKNLVDVQDIFFVQESLDESYLRQGAKWLKIEMELDAALQQGDRPSR